MKIKKMILPDRFVEHLNEAERNEERYTIYYLLNDAVYICSPFMASHMLHKPDVLDWLIYAETIMIQDMSARKKTYKNNKGDLFFDLFEMGLWFLKNISSNDWLDILNFWRDLMDENNLLKYISITPQLAEKSQH